MSAVESGRLLILGGARSGKTSFALQAAGERSFGVMLELIDQALGRESVRSEPTGHVAEAHCKGGYYCGNEYPWGKGTDRANCGAGRGMHT